jgi:hypothetical protein
LRKETCALESEVKYLEIKFNKIMYFETEGGVCPFDFLRYVVFFIY